MNNFQRKNKYTPDDITLMQRTDKQHFNMRNLSFIQKSQLNFITNNSFNQLCKFLC